MNIHNRFEEIKTAKKNAEKVRILAFGSSNTDRRICGMHWLDCLDLAIKNKDGRIHHCINSGTGGETSGDLLDRFDTDAALYQPDIAFITVGGNDSNPDRNLDDVQYEKNLIELHRKFNDLGCFVIFQTYYALISRELPEERYAAFCRYMEITRNVAANTNSGLIDHMKYWLPLERNMPDKHVELMVDTFHVNPIGNFILGRSVAMEFGYELNDYCLAEAKPYITLMEKLNASDR